MKKFTKINYILTFDISVLPRSYLPILIGSSHVDEQHSAKSEVPYCVTSPTVPEQVTLTERRSTSAVTTAASGWTGR